MNEQPGGLTLAIDDFDVEVVVTGGGRFSLPIGPLALYEGPLERADPPSAVHLSNALGIVQDHIDDVLIEAPSVAATPSVVATGPHAIAVARVEVGARTVPDGYCLRRIDADDVFRTLVAEPAEQRRFNPGLDDMHLESIIGSCCVILGFMRRLDLQEITIDTAGGAPG
jgi:exopolyphosphatase/pppGpp-phosphohydrolase